MEVTGKRRRRHKQLPDGHKESRGYCKFKEQAVGRSVNWKTKILHRMTASIPSSVVYRYWNQINFLGSAIRIM
jgi:hypothetical protein